MSHSRGCNCNDSGHSNKGGQEEAGCGAGQQLGGGRLQSGSLRSLRQLLQCKSKGSSAKEVEEEHSQHTPASGIGQGEHEHWAMAVEDGGQRRSMEIWQQMPVGNGDAYEHSALKER